MGLVKVALNNEVPPVDLTKQKINALTPNVIVLVPINTPPDIHPTGPIVPLDISLNIL